jgi:hypothetical protein
MDTCQALPVQNLPASLMILKAFIENKNWLPS